MFKKANVKKANSARIILSTAAISMVLLAGCTKEAQNKISRDFANLVGKNLKVSYIDGGNVVKSWTVKGGKITSGKDEHGIALGYYYFWSEETGYVQLPIERTVIEEIR